MVAGDVRVTSMMEEPMFALVFVMIKVIRWRWKKSLWCRCLVTDAIENVFFSPGHQMLCDSATVKLVRFCVQVVCFGVIMVRYWCASGTLLVRSW